MNDSIVIKGAKVHNLKNINLEIPRDKLVVITGLSGSGKSSLAFDTLYAEGQRRYVESLSSYARQFLGLMEKPDVESIEGLSPAISIDQKTTSKNPRSTVGTVTEIYDFIRLLYARIGVPYCPKCGKKIEKQSIDQIVDNILELPEGTRIQVLAPVVRGKKGEYVKLLDDFQKDGFVRARVDGTMYELSDEGTIDFNHNPFSMPQGGMEALENMNPLDILAYQYDLVCNGYEMASGAVRNHNPELMVKAFEIAGYTEEDVKTKFGALYNAFQYGTPPHAGAAPGLDRMVMLISDANNIREVIAFPKNKKARDVLMGAPSKVSEKQLEDVHIKIVEEEKN